LTVGADFVQGANLAEYLFHQPLEQSLARKLTVMPSHMTFNDYVRLQFSTQLLTADTSIPGFICNRLIRPPER